MYGDRTDEKPNGEKPPFWDIVGVWKWEAWESYRGTPMEVAQKACNKLMHDLLIEYNMGDKIPDPNRPGPNYYDNCKKFNWVDALVKKHKNEVGRKFYETSEEELALILKLT